MDWGSNYQELNGASTQCVVPDNIHTPTTEGIRSSEGEGVLKVKIFTGKYKPKLEFPEG